MSPPVPGRTRVLLVDPDRPEPEVIAEAAGVLARGGLVAFPTETVYGLGVHALNHAALEALFAAKGRPRTDPLIVHVAAAADVDTIAEDIPPAAWALADRFWPGPLTLVLRKRPAVPALVSAGLLTVAVRVPSHPVAQALLGACRLPVAAPSANRFSRPSPTRAGHVLADLDGAIDLVLDAGPTPVGLESTVLDLTTTTPLVRRPGGVTIEALREIVPSVQLADHVRDERETQEAPGQLLRHYAPRASLTLYIGDSRRVADRIGAEVRTLVARGLRVGILAPEEDLLAVAPAIAGLAAAGRVRLSAYGAREDLARAAHELFAALRALDEEGMDAILASAPEEDGLALAIRDRLTRAAEGRVRRV